VPPIPEWWGCHRAELNGSISATTADFGGSWPTSAWREQLGQGTAVTAADKRLGMVLAAPTLILIVGFVMYPFLYNVWLSFQSLSSNNPFGGFVGLENYLRVFRDPSYASATIKTFVWTVGVVSGQVAVGLLIALLLNKPFRGVGIARSLMIIPYTISTVVVAFIFKWMLNDLFGIVNHVLLAIGIVREPVIWLGTSNMAMLTAIAIAIWQAVPLVVLMLLAGLQTIPQDIYDAARVDGANRFQELWHVTLPGLRRVLEVVVILKTIWTFNWFDLIWLLTQGGPAGGTATLPVLVYQEGFKLLRFSRASAISVTMLVYLVVLIFVIFRITGTPEAET
jgi:multiple sugar transport system permease protein